MAHALPELALAPLLASLPGQAKKLMDWLSTQRFRFVQLGASQPGMRPRDLDQSARRDLLATLRRRELEVAGLDLWVPPEHFLEDGTVDRAVGAVNVAIDMAGDLGRVPVSLTLPHVDGDELFDEVLASLLDKATARGVALADHATAVSKPRHELLCVGVDPAAHLAAGGDPAQVVSEHADRLVAARLSDLNTSGMRCGIGEHGGRLDVTAYRVALSVAGYDRPVVVDARQWADPLSAVQRTAAVWADTIHVS